MQTESKWTCDVCGTETSHLQLKKPPERPHDRCQSCVWRERFNVDALTARAEAAEKERDEARAERDRLQAGWTEAATKEGARLREALARRDPSGIRVRNCRMTECSGAVVMERRVGSEFAGDCNVCGVLRYETGTLSERPSDYALRAKVEPAEDASPTGDE